MVDLTDRKQFELFAAAMALGGLMQKEGHQFRANLAQDEAQQLTEALANRGFFDEHDQEPKRYKPPVQRQRNTQTQIQSNDMMVVEER